MAKDLDKELGFEPISDQDIGFEPELSEEEQADVVNYMSKPEIPLSESARAGLAAGGTFGTANRLGAAGGALAEKLAGASLGPEGFPLVPGMESSKDKELSDLYNEYLAYNNKRQAAASEAHPIAYHGAEFLGAMASPLNKIGATGILPKNAAMLSKMGHGALAGARMGTLAGAAASPDLTNPAATIEHAGMGAALGGGLGGGLPPVLGGIKAAAGGAANIISPLIGKPGSMIKKGVAAGMEDSPNLAGEPGQLQAIEERGQFANQFVEDLNNILNSNAKNKRQLIAGALEKSQLAPKEAVDAVTQKYLEANPQLNEESARKELAQLKEMIVTAIEGPKTTETIRQYLPNQMEQDTGRSLEKHKKILSREIDPNTPLDVDAETATLDDITNPKTQKDLFEADVKKKQAELRALTGHGIDPESIETHYEPIEGSDKVMAVARAPIYSENSEAFTGSSEVPFQDVQQIIREGGRNLQNPEELYALQKNLQSKSQFSEGRGFSSQEMNRMSGEAAKDIASLIKMSVPDTVPVDERLNAFNNVAESLGINTDNLRLPGGEGQKARADAMKKILGVLSPEAVTDKSQLNQQSIDYVKNELYRVHPDISHAFGKEAEKHIENAGTINELVKPHTVGGGGPILSSIRRGLNKTAYNVGYGLGSEAKKMQPMVHSSKQLFQKYTPDALRKASTMAAQSTDQNIQKMGQVLSKLADSDDRTRNSMMFVLEQQAGYRQMMAPYFKQVEEGTPQAKNKGLEEYE